MEFAGNNEIANAVAEMRTQFTNGHWDEVVDLYEGIRDELKGSRQLRLEASCLASRSWAALKNRANARAVLAPVAKTEFNKPVHYEFLARAFLDLKLYQDAANACHKAHDLFSTGKPAAAAPPAAS